MKRKTKRLAQFSMCILISSCAACQNSDKQMIDKAHITEKASPLKSNNEMHTEPDKISVEQQIQDAVYDLATRTDAAVDAIVIRQARTVHWGSGALGCPKPGMNYTQALVPGVRLLLEANGTIYYYHGEIGKSLFNCPAERVRAPAYGQGLEVM